MLIACYFLDLGLKQNPAMNCHAADEYRLLSVIEKKKFIPIWPHLPLPLATIHGLHPLPIASTAQLGTY